MVKNADGTCSLSEKSRNQLRETDSVSKLHGVGECDASNNEYYEVEKVLEVRLNKDFHTEEYKVRFKGYTSEDDMWLPSSALKEPVTFQSVSKRGRV